MSEKDNRGIPLAEIIPDSLRKSGLLDPILPGSPTKPMDLTKIKIYASRWPDNPYQYISKGKTCEVSFTTLENLNDGDKRYTYRFYLDESDRCIIENRYISVNSDLLEEQHHNYSYDESGRLTYSYSSHRKYGKVASPWPRLTYEELSSFSYEYEYTEERPDDEYTLRYKDHLSGEVTVFEPIEEETQ